LAAMGFDVTGFDLSEQVILEAKKYENENLHFYLHDMRLPFWINYFGYAFNFFTSFGYFNTQREHDDAMRTITQSLRPNGIFVIDYLNVHFAEDCLVKSEKLEINDSIFNITRHYDEQHFYKQIQVENQNGTVDDVFTERITKFSLGDFIDMLAYQEMQIKDVFGDYLLSHYDIRKSPRMIIVAEKKVRKVN
jgi:SAM-dependent methyltransferase